MINKIIDSVEIIGVARLHPSAQILPFIGSKISAGFPSPATDYMEDGLDLNEYLIEHKAASFIFRVKGDSMRDAGILDGDQLIVDRAIEAQHDHIVVAVVNGDFTVKRLYKRGQRIELHPANPDFAAIIPGADEEITVWGVVISSFRKFC